MRIPGYDVKVGALLDVLNVPMPFEGAASSENRSELVRRLRAAFDVGRILGVLARLRMRDGFVLDYTYHFRPDFDGFPTLYARPRHAPPLDRAELADSRYCGLFPFHVETDGSPEGFLELELFRLLGHQFFLFWHANYMSLTPVCGPRGLDRVAYAIPAGGLSRHVRRHALDLDLDPTVDIESGRVTVRTVVFTPWQGFLRQETVFAGASPHVVMAERTETLLDYDCGVVF